MKAPVLNDVIPNARQPQSKYVNIGVLFILWLVAVTNGA